MPREKSAAGKNEELDIEYIIHSINTKNATGLQLLYSYDSDIGGEQILSAQPREGGNRKKHYDFLVVKQESKPQVEHKSCQKEKEISLEDTPWNGGVQFHNGGCEMYKFTPRYAKSWYDTLVASGFLKQKHNLTSAIPSFDEFWGECKTQGEPKTPFMRELKYMGGLMRDERKLILDAFELEQSEIDELKDSVYKIANTCLSEKHLWLSINGNIKGKFYSKWYHQFRIKSIDKVEPKKLLDLKIFFTCKIEKYINNVWVESPEDFIFHGHLRWGSHQGITNLRFDLK